MDVRLAVDVMGGDTVRPAIAPVVGKILAEDSAIRIILVGDEKAIDRQLRKDKAGTDGRVSIQHASQTVDLHEPPLQALRSKRDSSMRVAINLVKSGDADACVSVGNTAALLVISQSVLKVLPGIEFPAIVSAIPSMSGHTYLLDLGANLRVTARGLFEFAFMGAALASAVDRNPSPKVALLNMGEEEIKGGEHVKEASELLGATDLNYIGFVEGDDIFKGTADVIACDGFSGNVAIKSSQGLADMIRYFLKEDRRKNLIKRAARLIAGPVLTPICERLDPRHYNSASIVGLHGVVIKSHEDPNIMAFANAIRQAYLQVRNEVPQRIGEYSERMAAPA